MIIGPNLFDKCPILFGSEATKSLSSAPAHPVAISLAIIRGFITGNPMTWRSPGFDFVSDLLNDEVLSARLRECISFLLLQLGDNP